MGKSPPTVQPTAGPAALTTASGGLSPRQARKAAPASSRQPPRDNPMTGPQPGSQGHLAPPAARRQPWQRLTATVLSTGHTDRGLWDLRTPHTPPHRVLRTARRHDHAHAGEADSHAGSHSWEHSSRGRPAHPRPHPLSATAANPGESNLFPPRIRLLPVPMETGAAPWPLGPHLGCGFGAETARDSHGGGGGVCQEGAGGLGQAQLTGGHHQRAGSHLF